MGALIQGIVDLLGIQAPQTLSELLPWVAGLLFSAGFVSYLLDTIKELVRSVGRSSR